MLESRSNRSAQANVRIRSGLLKRLREVHAIVSEDEQARMIGVDRSTLRSVDEGAQPSAAFMADLCSAYGLGLGEAFEVAMPPRSRTSKDSR
jgi:predicted transcriptional regulator